MLTKKGKREHSSAHAGSFRSVTLRTQPRDCKGGLQIVKKKGRHVAEIKEEAFFLYSNKILTQKEEKKKEERLMQGGPKGARTGEEELRILFLTSFWSSVIAQTTDRCPERKEGEERTGETGP